MSILNFINRSSENSTLFQNFQALKSAYNAPKKLIFRTTSSQTSASYSRYEGNTHHEADGKYQFLFPPLAKGD